MSITSCRSYWLAGVLCLACAPLRPRASEQLVLTGGATELAIVERRTVSLALDRITKRQPELNGIVEHAGTGRGVAIYVFDGGVAETHPELAGRVRIGFDAFPSKPRVCNPHGTAVAGAAAGATLGVASEAEIVDVKIINCETQRGAIGAIVDAARWAAADHRRHPGQAAVANWSFVVDTSVVASIGTAIAVLRNAGIVVVASAGNIEMNACRVSPANAHPALVVGASSVVQTSPAAGFRDVRTRETAWGRCVDIYAPGDSVLLPAVQNGVPRAVLWNGTSMAAGYVSGAAALVLERTPRATPETVASTLVSQATADAVDERITATGRAGRLLYIGPTP